MPNAGLALAKILGSFHDDAWRLRLESLYEGVSPEVLRSAAGLDEHVNGRSLKEGSGAEELVGDESLTVAQRLWAQPSLDVHGLTCGYQGDGTKTVLPATAHAKASIRLAPGQDAHQMARAIEHHVKEVTPCGTRITIEWE